jgi:hypothetical protein
MARMSESIRAEVERTLSAIPVRAAHQIATTEYQMRVGEILNLLDIDTVVDEKGMHFGGEGVELEDQPLLWAIDILVARRFGIPEAIP